MATEAPKAPETPNLTNPAPHPGPIAAEHDWRPPNADQVVSRVREGARDTASPQESTEHAATD